MTLKEGHKKYISFIDLAVRIFLAFFMIDYGVSKLNGGMFDNATEDILNTPLKEVDLFHLTWYWFHKNQLLSVTVGIFQIIGSLLLLYKRTVLIGCALLLPILLNILLIDIYCTNMPALVARIGYYIFLVFLLCYLRRDKVIEIFRLMTMTLTGSATFNIYKQIIFTILALVLLVIIELFVVFLTNTIF